jgi:formylglycine-generating enzyme required for sulfatase activity
MCTARAYCAWAGKHLCGGTDGGAAPRGRETTQASAWFHACTGGYDLIASHFVNDVACRLDADGSVDVGTTCQGGVPGLSEMVGNVWEWLDETMPADASAPYQGYIAGGSYVDPTADCKSLLRATDIGLKSADIGFRCCSP